MYFGKLYFSIFIGIYRYFFQLQLIPHRSFAGGHSYLGLSEQVCETTLPSFIELTEDPKAKDMVLGITLAPIK